MNFAINGILYTSFALELGPVGCVSSRVSFLHFTPSGDYLEAVCVCVTQLWLDEEFRLFVSKLGRVTL